MRLGSCLLLGVALACVAPVLAHSDVSVNTPPPAQNAPPPPPQPRGRPTVISNPDWAALPTASEFQRFYPARAARMGVEGHVLIECEVVADGTVRDCVVLSEQPADLGFGNAALRLSTLFRMKPMTRDGRPVDGGMIRVPIGFKLPKPVHLRSTGGDAAPPAH
jgi:periplasmic protein TonB